MKALNLGTEEIPNIPEKPPKIEPGAYVAKIVTATDCPTGYNPKKPTAGDYLKLEIDIAEGEFTDYYKDLFDRFGFWGLTSYRSYKPENLGFFKSFIKTIMKSNPSLYWNFAAGNDEHALEGCKIGVILEAEKYTNLAGEERQKMKIKRIVTVDEVESGKYSSTNASAGRTATIIIANNHETMDAPKPDPSTDTVTVPDTSTGPGPDTIEGIAADVPF